MSKRYPLNMRTTRELRDRIEAAAAASGRSLVQEVEHRIERSFAEGDLVEALLGKRTAGLLRAISRLIPAVEQYTKKYWESDKETNAMLGECIREMLVEMYKHERLHPASAPRHAREVVGAILTEEQLRAVR